MRPHVARHNPPQKESGMNDLTPDASAAAAPDDLPFERALEQLEEIVRRLERGDVPLDESVAIYERGSCSKTCPRPIPSASATPRWLTGRRAAVPAPGDSAWSSPEAISSASTMAVVWSASISSSE